MKWAHNLYPLMDQCIWVRSTSFYIELKGREIGALMNTNVIREQYAVYQLISFVVALLIFLQVHAQEPI